MLSYPQFRGSTLEDLSLRRVCLLINETCRHLQKFSEQQSIPQALALAKQTIRPYYVNKLPSCLRSQIFEEVLKMLQSCKTVISEPAMIYLVTLLLSHGTKHLKIPFCCHCECNHQSYLLELLASEGIGLESLNISRSSLRSFDCKRFHSALLNMKNLSKLSLQKIASDAMLKIIGKTCTKLVILDVSYSKRVTDMGVKQLLLQVESQDEISSMSSEQSIKARKHWSQNISLFNIPEKNDTSSYFFRSERNEKPVVSFKYHENRNSRICDTLRRLHLTKTCITYESVELALINVPQLEFLLDDMDMAEFIIFISRLADHKISFNLTEMKIRRPFQDHESFEILAQVCPLLEKIYFCKPYCSFDKLHIFSRITSLIVHDIPKTEEWLNICYNYIQTNGKNLEELDLRWVTLSNESLDVDVRKILINCPNLHTLAIYGGNLIWTEGCNPMPLIYLRNVELAYRISVSSVIQLLSLTPELTTLYLYDVPDLKDKHLEELLKPPINSEKNQVLNKCNNVIQNLICLYIDAHHISATAVQKMLFHCKRLKWFGNKQQWRFDLDKKGRLRLKTIFRNIHYS